MTTEASLSDDWETPDDLFELCRDIWGIEADACASAENTKMPMFISKEDDALGDRTWRQIIFDKYGETVNTFWCNPPYGKPTKFWVARIIKEVELTDISVVSLLPAYTDQNWFKDIKDQGSGFYFLRKRLKFKPGKTSARFPNVITALGYFRDGEAATFRDELVDRCTLVHY